MTPFVNQQGNNTNLESQKEFVSLKPGGSFFSSSHCYKYVIRAEILAAAVTSRASHGEICQWYCNVGSH